MLLNVDCEESNSSLETRFIIDKILNIVDEHKTKELESLKSDIEKTDETFLPIFLGLINKGAITSSIKTIKGKSKIVLKTANRNSIYYALSNLKDVYSLEMLKTWFEFCYNSELKEQLKKFKNIELNDMKIDFNSYVNGDFYTFCKITDYCYSEYKKHEERINRQPVPSPIPITQNVIYTPSYDIMVTRKENNTKTPSKSKPSKPTKQKSSVTTKSKKETTKTNKTTTKITKKNTVDKTTKVKTTKSVALSDNKKQTKITKSIVSKQTKTTKTKQPVKSSDSKAKATKKQPEKIIKTIKSPVNSYQKSLQKSLNDINAKLNKSFHQFITISQEFINNYSIQDENAKIEILTEDVKQNLDQVDKIRRELKKLSTLRQRFNKIKQK